ncbi:hypothetical protein GJ631_12560 [Natronomonas sp. CBA1123]|uniref:hypothetical protein n=1 Tax=Natronomonas sp. CBA1123 TaxID=2668070 RepID=UPI0012EA20C8|nr:hypothetical protein [Natronomonas sp. CBA1123]MUV87371.1 hypothetical protein [Natronomonas sp. CBA1123]
MANDIAVAIAVVAVFVAATVGSAGGTAALLSDQESVTVPRQRRRGAASPASRGRQ